MNIGQRVSIPAGSKVRNSLHNIVTKLDAPVTVTLSDVATTKAGNLKVTWRGHRGYKTTILKNS